MNLTPELERNLKQIYYELGHLNFTLGFGYVRKEGELQGWPEYTNEEHLALEKHVAKEIRDVNKQLDKVMDELGITGRYM